MRDLEGNEIEVTEERKRRCSIEYGEFSYFCSFCHTLRSNRLMLGSSARYLMATC